MTKDNSAKDLDKEEPLEDIPENWVEIHGNYLFRYAYVRVNSKELAEDLVQETLLSAVRGFDKFEGRSAIKTWLTGILKNKIIDHMRRNARKEGKEILEEDTDTFDRHFNRFGIWNRVLQNWAADPDEVIQKKEFYAVFENCLSKIPEKSRRAFILKTFENVESEEICNILEVSSSNLWVLLHRCRMSLRECIERNWENV